MLKFSEIFEFSKEKFRKIPILKEFEWFEWFEWFGPSPIEPGSTLLRAELQQGSLHASRGALPGSVEVEVVLHLHSLILRRPFKRRHLSKERSE